MCDNTADALLNRLVREIEERKDAEASREYSYEREIAMSQQLQQTLNENAQLRKRVADLESLLSVPH